ESLMPQEPEIIIVDDGSSDGTPDSVLKLRAQFPRIHLIQRNGRKGIGSAVREGIQFALANTASGYIVTMDADGSHNPDELPGLLAAARGVDFVQGSRYVEGGAIRGWPPLRRLLSIVGNNACRILFQTGFHEHTTFYRVFNRDCAEHIVERVVDDGYAWGV
ncbi:MAG: glycosyltransferase, partial [Methanobacteriota archaeon]